MSALKRDQQIVFHIDIRRIRGTHNAKIKLFNNVE